MRDSRFGRRPSAPPPRLPPTHLSSHRLSAPASNNAHSLPPPLPLPLPFPFTPPTTPRPTNLPRPSIAPPRTAITPSPPTRASARNTPMRATPGNRPASSATASRTPAKPASSSSSGSSFSTPPAQIIPVVALDGNELLPKNAPYIGGEVSPHQTRHVFISDVGNVSEEVLRRDFSKFGLTEAVRVVNSQDRRCAYIHFTKLHHASAAYDEALKKFPKSKILYIKGERTCALSVVPNPPTSVSILPQVTPLLLKFGTTKDIRFVSSQQCVFVEFAKVEHAVNAMRSLQGQFIGDYQLFVDYAKENKSKGTESAQSEKEKEIEREKEKEREREREKDREREREKEKEREKERERLREKEREREKEKEKEREREREKLRAKEKEREKEREQRAKEKNAQREREKAKELDRLRELDRAKAKDKGKEREKEKETGKEKEKDKEKEKEKEKDVEERERGGSVSLKRKATDEGPEERPNNRFRAEKEEDEEELEIQVEEMGDEIFKRKEKEIEDEKEGDNGEEREVEGEEVGEGRTEAQSEGEGEAEGEHTGNPDENEETHATTNDDVTLPDVQLDFLNDLETYEEEFDEENEERKGKEGEKKRKAPEKERGMRVAENSTKRQKSEMAEVWEGGMKSMGYEHTLSAFAINGTPSVYRDVHLPSKLEVHSKVDLDYLSQYLPVDTTLLFYFLPHYPANSFTRLVQYFDSKNKAGVAKFRGNSLYLIPAGGIMAARLGVEPNTPGLIGALVMSKFIPAERESRK